MLDEGVGTETDCKRLITDAVSKQGKRKAKTTSRIAKHNTKQSGKNNRDYRPLLKAKAAKQPTIHKPLKPSRPG